MKKICRCFWPEFIKSHYLTIVNPTPGYMGICQIKLSSMLKYYIKIFWTIVLRRCNPQIWPGLCFDPIRWNNYTGWVQYMHSVGLQEIIRLWCQRSWIRFPRMTRNLRHVFAFWFCFRCAVIVFRSINHYLSWHFAIHFAMLIYKV